MGVGREIGIEKIEGAGCGLEDAGDVDFRVVGDERTEAVLGAGEPRKVFWWKANRARWGVVGWAFGDWWAKELFDDRAGVIGGDRVTGERMDGMLEDI